jgi:hypothetical protein
MELAIRPARATRPSLYGNGCRFPEPMILDDAPQPEMVPIRAVASFAACSYEASIFVTTPGRTTQGN